MFDTGAATHVGNVRGRNEDSYLAYPDAGIWAVADGMGGHEAGDLASRLVIEALQSIKVADSAADLLDTCEERIGAANVRLKEIGRERGGVIVGATLALLLAFGDYYACLWAGDSRIYIVRDNKIMQLSQDHTELADLLTRGAITPEEARAWTARNALTRAIGGSEDLELEIASGAMLSGDAFVICSDGLTRHVTDQEILHHVSNGTSQQACERLVTLTLERGATDNVTLIVVRFQPDLTRDVAPSGREAQGLRGAP